MKSILYVGATLMIGASIYGFVDYKKAMRRHEFKDMYETEKPVATTVKKSNPVITVIDNEAELKQEAGLDVIKEKQTKRIKKGETPVAEVISSEFREPAEVLKKSRKRRLKSDLFSRAPLREEMEIEVKPLDTKALRDTL